MMFEIWMKKNNKRQNIPKARSNDDDDDDDIKTMGVDQMRIEVCTVLPF